MKEICRTMTGRFVGSVTVSCIILTIVTGCGDASTTKRQNAASQVNTGQSSDNKFVRAVYAAFRRQTDNYIRNVRPEGNESKKFQLWGVCTKDMANDLALITADVGTDEKLVELRQNLQDQAESVSRLLLAPNARENFKVITQEGNALSELQDRFDSYVKAKGY